MFEEEKKFLKQLFSNSLFKIEHVASIVVKSLLAKLIIDIAVGVNSFNELDDYKEILNSIYKVKENLDNNKILLVKENDAETFFLIHVLLVYDEQYQNLI